MTGIPEPSIVIMALALRESFGKAKITVVLLFPVPPRCSRNELHSGAHAVIRRMEPVRFL